MGIGKELLYSLSFGMFLFLFWSTFFKIALQIESSIGVASTGPSSIPASLLSTRPSTPAVSIISGITQPSASSISHEPAVGPKELHKWNIMSMLGLTDEDITIVDPYYLH